MMRKVEHIVDSKKKQTMRVEEAAQNFEEEDIDKLMDSLAQRMKNDYKNSKKPFNFDKWCDEIDKHPAFVRELKATENGQYSEQVQALQAMKYDEDDPAECAIAYKEEGNRHFAKGNYRWAIEAYTKGIKLSCADGPLNSILFANRAAANKRLANVRSAFKDCLFSRRFNPANLKAIRCGAECLLELGEAAKCVAWIELNESDETSSAIKRDEHLEKLRKKAETMRAEEDKERRRERARISAERKRKTKLLEALRARGVRLRPPVDEPDELIQQLEISFGSLERHSMVRLAEEGTEREQLIWPLLLQYPERGQTDFVTDCAENMLMDEALAEVFSSPAHWDVPHDFRPDNIRLFVALSCDDGEERIREILPEKHSLGVVLHWSDVFVTRGLPVIQVYTKPHLEHNKLRTLDRKKGIFHFETDCVAS